MYKSMTLLESLHILIIVLGRFSKFLLNVKHFMLNNFKALNDVILQKRFTFASDNLLKQG